MSSRGRLSAAKSCARPTWLSARGTDRWSFGLPKALGRGPFLVRAKAVDSAGNVGPQHTRHLRVR
jgi:hypothetical protein